MHFAITLPTPPNYPHTEATREVAEPLYHALVSLGHDTILTAIVLNMHFHEAKVFELVRVSYLLANERFVVCERGCDTGEEEEFAPGVVFTDYGDLVQTCVDYLGRAEERRRIARAGFELMRRLDLCAYLRPVLEE